MTKLVKIYESGSGKYIMIEDGVVLYTSDVNQATQFNYQLLFSANQAFHDFSIYKMSLHVVPQGSNQYPGHCELVRTYLNDPNNQPNEGDHNV